MPNAENLSVVRSTRSLCAQGAKHGLMTLRPVSEVRDSTAATRKAARMSCRRQRSRKIAMQVHWGRWPFARTVPCATAQSVRPQGEENDEQGGGTS